VQSVSGQGRGGLITIYYCLIRGEGDASSPLVERERRESWWGGSVRHYRVGRGIIETEFGSLKVPRQCTLVLVEAGRSEEPTLGLKSLLFITHGPHREV
jgi:hypothetical protein